MNTRIEKILHLGSMIASNEVSEELEKVIHKEWEEILPLLGEEYYAYIDIENLTKKGFLIKASTPIPDLFFKGNKYSHLGWGHVETKWFYTEVFEDIFDLMEEWRKSVVQKAKHEEGVEILDRVEKEIVVAFNKKASSDKPAAFDRWWNIYSCKYTVEDEE